MRPRIRAGAGDFSLPLFAMVVLSFYIGFVETLIVINMERKRRTLFELVITNGLVLDGTGREAQPVDVAVDRGKIAALGANLAAQAARVIDAGGQFVTPGFIDIHSHGDLMPFMGPPVRYAKILQGVTTEVTGQCGLGVAPYLKDTMAGWREYLTPITGNPGDELWDWPSFGDYLEALRKASLPANMAPLVSHGAIRAQVLGLGDVQPTGKDLERMGAILKDSFEAGAFGISFGLAYVPGVFAPAEEVLALARIAAAYDKVMMVHIRNHGRLVEQSLREVLEIARETGVRLQISHLKSYANRRYGVEADRLIAPVEEAKQQGVDVAFDEHPYTAGSTTLSQILPPWAKEGGGARIVERLGDPAVVAAVKEAIERVDQDHWDNYVGMIGWDNVLVSSVCCPENREYQGKSIAEIARLRGETEMEAAIYLLTSEKAECGMVMRDVFAEADNRLLIRHPLCQIGSDGLPTGNPHPRLYSAFPKYLAHYIRDLKLLDWPEGIKKITKDAADRAGIKDRGTITVGKRADLVIFDPDQIRDREDYLRPERVPAGISYVFVNGNIAVAHGQVACDHGGQVLGM